MMMKKRVYKRNKNRMFSSKIHPCIHIHTPIPDPSFIIFSILFKHSVLYWSFIMCWGCQRYFWRCSFFFLSWCDLRKKNFRGCMCAHNVRLMWIKRNSKLSIRTAVETVFFPREAKQTTKKSFVLKNNNKNWWNTETESWCSIKKIIYSMWERRDTAATLFCVGQSLKRPHIFITTRSYQQLIARHGLTSPSNLLVPVNWLLITHTPPGSIMWDIKKLMIYHIYFLCRGVLIKMSIVWLCTIVWEWVNQEDGNRKCCAS